jgi:hypothetical protein
MDWMTVLVVPGLVGGLVLGIALLALHRRPGTDVAAAAASEPVSTDFINMAHIRVSGVGGLGLVATALAVGIYIPELRWALAIGLVLGILLAALLILRRRRSGPMPSSGERGGANTMLAIDAPVREEPEAPADQRQDCAVTMAPVSPRA